MSDGFFRSGGSLFSGLMVGNFLNYLFQITMGRLLAVETYGEVNALLSIMVITSVPFSSITNYLAKNISQLNALGYGKKVNSLIALSYKNVFIAGLVAVVIGSFLSPFMADYLKLDSTVPFLLLLSVIFLSSLIPINTGILQGLHRFHNLSFLSALSAFSKYIICVAAVLLGLGLNGVMAGSALSALLVAVVSYYPIAKLLGNGREPIAEQEVDSVSYIIPILVMNLSFAILTQADIVLVKRLFATQEAGIYSAAAIIGKAVMYLPGALVLALFPMVSAKKAQGQATLHLLIKALAATVALSGLGAVVLYLTPEMIVSILFGKKFVPSASLAGSFGLAMLPYAVLTVLMNYNLAKGKHAFAYLMLVLSIVQVIAIYNWHDSLFTILKIVFGTGFICVTSQFCLLIFEYYRERISSLGTALLTGKFRP